MQDNNTYAVIGAGKYGSAIARELARKGSEVFVFDSSEEKIEDIKDDVAFSVVLDACNKKALKSQNIQDVDAVVLAIGENFEAQILAAVHMLELQPKRIIARASSPQQKIILEKIGVEEILTPEEEVAFIVTERLQNPSIISFLQLPDNYEIAEIKAPKEITNKTIENIGLRNKYNLTIVTIKREYENHDKNGTISTEEHILGVPDKETVIQNSDTIVVFGRSKDVARFIEVNQ
ncbi:MAG: TrkA family potassium uptake protein [Flavobacteriales bacterium]